MHILKSNYTQMVLVGLIFSLILGVLGFFSYGLIKKNEFQKKIIIVDSTKTNPLTGGITRLNVIKDEDLDYRMNTINEEFLESVQYTILRYQRDERLKGGCHKMQFKLTDDSIFIETHGYPMQNESLMDRCINNLLDLSFERLKSKIEQNTNQQILKIKFIKDDLSLKQKKIQNRIKKNEKNKNDTNNMFSELCENLASYSLNGTGGINFVNKSESISNSDLFHNILYLSTMMRQCDKIYFFNIDKEIENLMKTERNLQKAKNILIDSDFLDVFKIETLSAIIENNTSYISKKNMVITFSLLGFIFGILLFYNFRISK